MAIGGRFGAALPFQPIHRKNGLNWLNWHCCLAGSSKTASRILIFSMTMGADYSLELISIETYAPQPIGHNKFFLGSVPPPPPPCMLSCNDKTKCRALVRGSVV